MTRLFLFLAVFAADQPTTPATRGDLVTLRDYVDMRFDAFEKTQAASEKATDHRLFQMNELRDQIESERGTYVTRAEAMWAFGALLTVAGVVMALSRRRNQQLQE